MALPMHHATVPMTQLGAATMAIVENIGHAPRGLGEPPSYMVGGGCFTTHAWVVEEQGTTEEDGLGGETLTLHRANLCHYCDLPAMHNHNERQLLSHHAAGSMSRLMHIRGGRPTSTFLHRMLVLPIVKSWKRFVFQRRYIYPALRRA